MSANRFEALVEKPVVVPKTGKSRKAKKNHCAPQPQCGRLDSPGSLSSADKNSVASAEQETRGAGFQQVPSRRSRSSTPSSFAPMIDSTPKDDEDYASSISTVAESKALLNKWTGQVVANGGSQDGDNDNSFREAFLQSKALDMFVERYTTFGDLDGIKGALTALLGVLVQDGRQDVALELAYAIVRMARRFPTSSAPEDIQHCREAVVGNAVRLLISYIAEKEQSPEKARAQLEERHRQVIRLEEAINGAPTPGTLKRHSAGLLKEVQSRLALDSSPVGVLDDIQSLECLLEKGIEDSRKSTPARREELQREKSELSAFILQKQTEKEELESKLSKVMAELDQSQARQQAVEALLTGNAPAPRISADQMQKQMAAVLELKKAAESLLPKDGDAVDFTIPDRADNAPGPEGLSPADFLKHYLSVHNKIAQQVLRSGKEVAGLMRGRQGELDTLHSICAKEEMRQPARDALAAHEKQMKELQEKARVLQSAGDAAIALARAQPSVLASPGALSALEQVYADLSAACKELIHGPTAMSSADAAREKKAKKQKKPRAPEANGSAEAAAPEAAAPAAATRADAPQGKSGNGFENKPRPAQKRGPNGGPPAKNEKSEAEKAREALEQARKDLGIKSQTGAPSRTPTAVPRPVANGAAQNRPAAPPPPTTNPWNKKVIMSNITDQPANGHAEAAAAKPVAPPSEATTELANGHAEAGPAANGAIQENGAAPVENGSMAASE